MKIDWERIPTINARWVCLRPFTETDRNSVYAVYSDPEVMRYWGSLPMKQPQDAVDFLADVLQDLQRHQCLQWGIARRSDNQLIGTLAIFRLDSFAGKAELGFALGRAYWGVGYMRETLQAALGYLFNELDLRRIEADVDPRNLACIRLLERLGFQKEGYLRERWHVLGETQDSLFYGLLRREWNSSGAAYEVITPATLQDRRKTSFKAWVARTRLRRWAAMLLGMVAQ